MTFVYQLLDTLVAIASGVGKGIEGEGVYTTYWPDTVVGCCRRADDLGPQTVKRKALNMCTFDLLQTRLQKCAILMRYGAIPDLLY